MTKSTMGQEKPTNSLLEDDLNIKFSQAFDATYYLSQNPDVAAANMDPLKHYKKHGWREKRRPNDWFDPADYIKRYPELAGTDTNPFLHFLTHQESLGRDMEKSPQKQSENRVLYKTDQFMEDEYGRRPVIIASNMPGAEELSLVREHFDADFYTEQNPDVMKRAPDPLLHFMTLGWVEMRDPNPNFSVSYYLRENDDVRLAGVNPFVHYHRHGPTEKWRTSVTVADAKILDMFENDVDISEMLAKAKNLDPMVAHPVAKRRITSPLKWARDLTDVAQALRRKLAGKTYRYIVAVPHVRMSGASRVASIFADALAHVGDPSEILIITTDSSESEYIRWFSGKLDILDLSKEIELLGQEEKTRALIDLMRGVDCKTIINVNSSLVWDAMRLFGRQLHHEFNVVTYLFTWDENIKGDRAGYPIQWLRDTVHQHHLLLTDTINLANDISDRLGFDHLNEGAQVVPLYTPISGGTAFANRETRRGEGGHFLWAGRFDPQKRLDVLIAIAKANPHMTFDVYGKAVLGTKGLSEFDPPNNIINKGTYTDLQEVLNTPYTGFLYTSQWDGLPTILLDMASAGLPIVAPNVGGIAEMIDHTTGWLVDNFEDVDGYSAALSEMAFDPSGADERVRALQSRLADQFAPEGYINSVKKMVATYDL